ncbi:uncharacterized protein LOC125178702 [Hyalella azteca]|uniref:Uncharacterized protein LOC125178702 n=1 Tax=Hyalella azteca TaxID=294128 RepID=A0A979FQX7_HYAAZ|nr:uncharacterized protein LOC125178702 [Hyalella azteca]
MVLQDSVLHAGDRVNTSRVLLHGRSLVLQSVTRDARGGYACAAHNALGARTSDPVTLHVMYPPVCRDPPNQTIAIAPGQPTTLVCRVDSYPKLVRFRWAVNTSRGLAHVDPSRYRSKETSSFLVYKPQISLSQEAEEKRKNYYISQKRGFYTTDSSGGSNKGANGFQPNGFIETDEGKIRKIRDSSQFQTHFNEVDNTSTHALKKFPLYASIGIEEEILRNIRDPGNLNDEKSNGRLQAGVMGKKNWFDLDTRTKSSNNQQKISNFIPDSQEKPNYFTVDVSKSGKRNRLEPLVDSTQFATTSGGVTPAEGVVLDENLSLEDMGLEETYGVIYCWGENAQGTQQQPCVITVTPAGPPSPIRACRILNQTAAALQVLCRPGADGGLKQTFIAVVKDERTGEIVGNATSSTPLLTLAGLTAGTDYVVQVWTHNARGASRPFVLEGYALKVAENKIDNSQTGDVSGRLSVLLGASSAGFVLIAACLVVASKIRRKRRLRPPRSESDDAPKTSVSENEGEEDETERSRQRRNRETQESRLDVQSSNGPDLLMRTESSNIPLYSHLQPSPPNAASPVFQQQPVSHEIHECGHYRDEGAFSRSQNKINVCHNFHPIVACQRPHTPSIYSQTVPLYQGTPTGSVSGEHPLNNTNSKQKTKEDDESREVQKKTCEGCYASKSNGDLVGGKALSPYGQKLPSSISEVNFNCSSIKFGGNGTAKRTEPSCPCKSSRNHCNYDCTSLSVTSASLYDDVQSQGSCRQPPMQYATICRSFAVKAMEGKMCANSTHPYLTRGLSSHDLITRTPHDSFPFQESKRKPTDITEQEIECRQRRSSIVGNDTQEPPAQIWTHADTQRIEDTACHESFNKELRSGSCRTQRSGIAPSLGPTADKEQTDHTLQSLASDKTACHKAVAPLQCVTDLPRVKRDSHRYYTLKVSNARQNSESFV